MPEGHIKIYIYMYVTLFQPKKKNHPPHRRKKLQTIRQMKSQKQRKPRQKKTTKQKNKRKQAKLGDFRIYQIWGGAVGI